MSGDVNLLNIQPSYGILVPNFNSSQTQYIIRLSKHISSHIAFNITSVAPQTQIKIENNIILSNHFSSNYTLNIYNNTFIINVTSEDGYYYKLYTIVVYQPSTDSKLKSLKTPFSGKSQFSSKILHDFYTTTFSDTLTVSTQYQTLPSLNTTITLTETTMILLSWKYNRYINI